MPASGGPARAGMGPQPAPSSGVSAANRCQDRNKAAGKNRPWPSTLVWNQHEVHSIPVPFALWCRWPVARWCPALNGSPLTGAAAEVSTAVPRIRANPGPWDRRQGPDIRDAGARLQAGQAGRPHSGLLGNLSLGPPPPGPLSNPQALGVSALPPGDRLQYLSVHR